MNVKNEKKKILYQPQKFSKKSNVIIKSKYFIPHQRKQTSA